MRLDGEGFQVTSLFNREWRPVRLSGNITMTSKFGPTALVGLALAVSLSGAVAGMGEPIPGVDVELGKNPGGLAVVVATTDREGRFSAQVRVERGEYRVAMACATPRACPANRVLSLRVDSRTIRPNARGLYLFPVGASLGTVMLTGRVETLDPVSTTR